MSKPKCIPVYIMWTGWVITVGIDQGWISLQKQPRKYFFCRSWSLINLLQPRRLISGPLDYLDILDSSRQLISSLTSIILQLNILTKKWLIKSAIRELSYSFLLQPIGKFSGVPVGQPNPDYNPLSPGHGIDNE